MLEPDYFITYMLIIDLNLLFPYFSLNIVKQKDTLANNAVVCVFVHELVRLYHLVQHLGGVFQSIYILFAPSVLTFNFLFVVCGFERTRWCVNIFS